MDGTAAAAVASWMAAVKQLRLGAGELLWTGGGGGGAMTAGRMSFLVDGNVGEMSSLLFVVLL